MPLKIQTTGLENYAPGGNARVKVLVIGGPGAGKTRWASYFPKPIYADCEGGLSSVADRQVPFATVNSSQDMLDILEHLKMECRKPVDIREYQTVVIDTLDAFQRKVKNEWMEVNKKPTFTGWEAWGFLNAKMQMLMTRLLNLDMNVIVAVHYKDRTTKDDETGKETHELMLQLQGELADTAFNDFDLVGWMGTHWEAEDGQRVEKRSITFKRTPDKPFLKDRLFVTPKFIPVMFDDQDYDRLFQPIAAKAAQLASSKVVGEITEFDPDAAPNTAVVPVGVAGSGPLPAQAPREVDITVLDKPGLLKVARDEGIKTLADGSPIRGNTLKAELLAAIQHARSAKALESVTQAATAPAEAPAEAPAPAAEAPAAPEAAPAAAASAKATTPPWEEESVVDVSATSPAVDPVASIPAPRSAPDAAPAAPEAPAAEDIASKALRQVREGLVDADGVLVEDQRPKAGLEVVQQVLGGTVIKTEALAPEAPEPETPTVSTVPAARAAAPAAGACEECGKDLAEEPKEYIKLSRIKYRKALCKADYDKKKAGR